MLAWEFYTEGVMRLLIGLALVCGLWIGQALAVTVDTNWLFADRVRIGGSGTPVTRLEVRGDPDTRITIGGSNTAGLYFVRNGVDNGTIRVAPGITTPHCLEVWADNVTKVFDVCGSKVTFYGDVEVKGNIGAKYQ